MYSSVSCSILKVVIRSGRFFARASLQTACQDVVSVARDLMSRAVRPVYDEVLSHVPVFLPRVAKYVVYTLLVFFPFFFVGSSSSYIPPSLCSCAFFCTSLVPPCTRLFVPPMVFPFDLLPRCFFVLCFVGVRARYISFRCSNNAQMHVSDRGVELRMFGPHSSRLILCVSRFVVPPESLLCATSCGTQ